MGHFERGVKLAASIGAWIGSACVIISMVLIVVDVVGRKFFHFSVTGTSEVSQHLLIAITFLGFAFALKEGAHVDVQVVTQRLPYRAGKFCEIFASVVALCFCGCVTWLVGRQAIRAYLGNYEVMGVLHTPLYLVQMLMPIGFILFSMAFVVEILKAYEALHLQKSRSLSDKGRKNEQG